MEDKQIILLLREHPSEGLRKALQKYGGLVRLVVSRVLDNPQDIEECVADAFVNIWRSVERIRSESLKGYLLCAACNLAINRYRQQKRHCFVLLDENDSTPDDVALTVASQEQTAALQQLIMLMCEPDREILIRKYFMFESIREISQQMKLAESQIKGRLYRGRQWLKKALLKGVDNYAI